ncbi:hypothetical protein WA026_011710 [Henosepilachna vigintioctopunctata]|uniref:Dipeptidyl peptidase 3 n=1 Tax=Henosepilachna vigintioctopunctata TaxID=420089 RepID=A0AAW1UD51_9CUCU
MTLSLSVCQCQLALNCFRTRLFRFSSIFKLSYYNPNFPSRKYSVLIRRHCSLLKSYQKFEFLVTKPHFRMVESVDKSLYTLPADQPIVRLEVESAFNGLSEKEKLYAHYLSKASWVGGLVTLLQTSVESGPIFVLLHKLFSKQNCKDFKDSCLKNGLTEADINAFFIYTCGVFANAGNYKGFGDTKIIPNMEAATFEKILQCSSIWSDLQPIWNQVKDSIFDLGKGKTCLGLSPEGCTTYLSKNCTTEDNEKVTNWLKSHNLELWNTRLFKTMAEDGKVEYEIRLAGKMIKDLKKETIGNVTFRLTSGDYSPLMSKIALLLLKAVPHAANEMQEKMLESYVNHFSTGAMDEHKKGSRFWIKDKSPSVESYIGFIETYRDPTGIRGEFEGFVAVVNREMSAKFNTLVSEAEKFLPLLPWNKNFEKDKFLKPDFTSLDVLTFAGSGIPAGINIPNYDDIRQKEGFKNVSLGNVIPASYQATVSPFLSAADGELLQKYRIPAFELQVGLHELLGHGSGKLLKKELDGTCNFPIDLIDPLTGSTVTSYYDAGDTYDSKFGPLSSAYEECRAEAVGLYLSLEPAVLKIFGHSGSEADDIVYVNWLSLVWTGAGRGLEMWAPGRGWLQAHSQARFAIAQVLIQAGVARVTQPTKDDLLVTLDRSQIRGAGRNAIGHFLLQLQTYKATGNLKAAEDLFNQYSKVTEPWLSWRSIVLAKKQPRKIFVQSNTFEEKEKVNIKTYESTPEGLINSWIDRFDDSDSLHKAILDLTEKDSKHF